MISCKTCDHYEEYLKDGYVMYCTCPYYGDKATIYYDSTDASECIFHTKLDEYADEEEKRHSESQEQPKHQAIACTKCGHEMRIEG